MSNLFHYFLYHTLLQEVVNKRETKCREEKESRNRSWIFFLIYCRRSSLLILWFRHWNLLTAFDRSCLSHIPRQYTGLLSPTVKQQMQQPQQCCDCSFYTNSGWPIFAYVTNPVQLETRLVSYKLHPQGRSCFRFFHTPGTPHTRHIHTRFELWGGQFRSSLLASFFLPLGLLWKEFIPHIFVVTFHFSRSSGSPPVYFFFILSETVVWFT